MKKSRLFVVVLLLLCVSFFMFGCGGTSIPEEFQQIGEDGEIELVECNETFLGASYKVNCNTCSCGEMDGFYMWSCTEIGCGPF